MSGLNIDLCDATILGCPLYFARFFPGKNSGNNRIPLSKYTKYTWFALEYRWCFLFWFPVVFYAIPTNVFIEDHPLAFTADFSIFLACDRGFYGPFWCCLLLLKFFILKILSLWWLDSIHKYCSPWLLDTKHSGWWHVGSTAKIHFSLAQRALAQEAPAPINRNLANGCSRAQGQRATKLLFKETAGCRLWCWCLLRLKQLWSVTWVFWRP